MALKLGLYHLQDCLYYGLRFTLILNGKIKFPFSCFYIEKEFKELVEDFDANANKYGQLKQIFFNVLVIKKSYNAQFIAKPSPCTATELSEFLTFCLIAVKVNGNTVIRN